MGPEHKGQPNPLSRLLSRKIDRRTAIIGTGVGLGTVLVGEAVAVYKATHPDKPRETGNLLNLANQPHALTDMQDGTYLDSPLFGATGEVIQFRYNATYIDPSYPTAGSLDVQVSTLRPGIIRIASWQETPEAQAGGLIDKTYVSRGGNLPIIKHPVTGEGLGEHDRVAIGFDRLTRDPNTTKGVNARVYEVARTGDDTLQIQFTGIMKLGPSIPYRGGHPSP